jgi:ATP-dependent protease ClpP protease subunit
MKPKTALWGQAGDAEKIVDETCGVRFSNNRLYFYGDVDAASIGLLNDQLRKITNRLLAEAYGQERTPASIFLHVSSFGGSLLHGLAGLDTIRGLQVPIHSIVDGCCASAATFLTIAGKDRAIGKNSFMLIHQLSAGAWGKYAVSGLGEKRVKEIAYGAEPTLSEKITLESLARM